MARHYQRKYCLDGSINPQWKPNRRPRRSGPSKSRRKSGFIGWDGEGVTVNGTHRYIMLLASNGTRVVNPDGLTTRECLDAILAGAELDRWKYHVGFAFGYDVNMIVHELPRDLLRGLWHGLEIEWEGYKLRYRSRRQFTVKRGRRSACIWDVFGFFQSSFVKALESFQICNPAHIKAMKDRRDIFTLAEITEIEAYCWSEVGYLSDLMERFAEYLQTADLELQRYDGAGAVASAYFRKHGINEFRRRTKRRIGKAAQAAYYGGRIEMVQFGHSTRTVFQYDLRSAYPAALARAPCLKCGTWTHSRRPDGRILPFSLYRIRWKLTGNVLPFPWRAPNGAVYFPRTGQGWYWGVEIIAAKHAQQQSAISGAIQMLESWTYETECGHVPFSWVPEIYRQRAEWKREGIGAEKVLKLGLNSLYGKCAQRIGGRPGRPPQWHQIEWAGFATALTRARLYAASVRAIKLGAIVMYATDAVITTVPLYLPLSESLGEWECKEYNGIIAVQSGVYWLGKEHKAHTRGFRPTDIDPIAVVAAWRAGEPRYLTTTRRFIGMGIALMHEKGFVKWRQWIEEARKLSLTPFGTKRALAYPGRKVRPDISLIPTVAADVALLQDIKGIDSTPLALPWQIDKLGVDPSDLMQIQKALAEAEDG